MRPPEQAFSDEPLINAIHRRVIEFTLVAYTAILVYISFVPFDFTRHPNHNPAGLTVWGLAVVPFPILDILANLGIYLPLGALVFAVARRKGMGRIISGSSAVIFAALTSFLIEYGQHWVVSRVASWVDVAANILGAIMGAGLVCLGEGQIRRILSHAGFSARQNWPLTLCKAWVCIILLVHLRPYDVVVDLQHTAAEAVRKAEVSPLAGWNGLRRKVAQHVKDGRRRGMYELPRVKCEYVLDRAVDVATYAGVVALVIIGMAPSFRKRRLLYLWAGFVAVSLAGMVTVVRVFLMSHGVDTAHFVCGLAAWPVGCLVGHRILQTSRESPGARDQGTGVSGEKATLARSPAPPLPRSPLTSIAIAAALVTAISYELVPFDFGTGTGANSPSLSDRVCLVPFLAHFNSRPNDAFFDISGEMLTYGVIGLCLTMLLGSRYRWTWRTQLWVTMAATGTVGLVLESLHLIMGTRQTSLLTVMIAVSGGFVGAVLLRWIADYRASLSVMTDDLLTRQLIEGRTYKALPAVVDDPLTRQLIEDGKGEEETPKSRKVKKSKPADEEGASGY